MTLHLLPDRVPQPESRFTAPTSACPHPEWWSSTDIDSTEREVADLVYGLTRALQPRAVLETGTAFGEVAERVAAALWSNGHGHLWTLEVDHARVEYARRRIEFDTVTVVETDTLTWTPPDGTVFDLCWFDAYALNRVKEFERYWPWMRAGTIVAFHDTAQSRGLGYFPGSDLRSTIADALRRKIRMIHLPTPRGLTLGEVLPS